MTSNLDILKAWARCSKPHASSEQTSSSNQQGLTLIESIMAILVIAITAGLIIPPLFVAAATRVQARRAEEAVQLAQGEIDRIRAMVEQNSTNLNDLIPPDQYGGTIIAVGEMATVEGPERDAGLCRSINSDANTYDGLGLGDANQYLLIDIDGDAQGGNCNAEYIMQTFRSENTADSQMNIGVRVYSSLALRTLEGGDSLDTEEAGLKLTTGAGQQLAKPLAVMFTKISTVNSFGIDPMCRFQNHSDC